MRLLLENLVYYQMSLHRGHDPKPAIPADLHIFVNQARIAVKRTPLQNELRPPRAITSASDMLAPAHLRVHSAFTLPSMLKAGTPPVRRVRSGLPVA